MDILGTKRAVAVFEQALGVTLPKTDAALTKLAAALDQEGVVMGHADDLILTTKAAIDGMALPDTTKALAHAALAIVDHYIRVGTQVSKTAKAGQELIDKASRKLDAVPDRLFPLTVDAPRS